MTNRNSHKRDFVLRVLEFNWCLSFSCIIYSPLIAFVLLLDSSGYKLKTEHRSFLYKWKMKLHAV